MPDAQEFAVFVPANTTESTPFALSVADGSAIVGCPSADTKGLITVYYEGNIYEAANVETYADRARLAAGRLKKLYPSVARANVPRSWLVQIGWFDPQNGITLLDAQAEKALVSWLGVEEIKAEELCFSN